MGLFSSVARRLSRLPQVNNLFFKSLCLWFLLGAILRIAGLTFGLPHLSRPDEENISAAVLMRIMLSFQLGMPDLNPKFFDYPSLFIYLTLLFDTIFYALGWLAGAWTDVNTFIDVYLNNYGPFHFIQRSISCVFGIATLPVVYLLARRLFRSNSVAWVATALMSVAYMHVRDSHFGVTDVMATCMAMACLWASIKAYQLPQAKASRRWFWIAAILAGLTAGSKYPVGVVTVAPLLGIFLRYRNPLWVLQLAILAVASFVVTTPYFLIDPEKFWQDFMQQRLHLWVGHGLAMDWGYWYHLRFSLWYGLGGLLCITGYAGMLWAGFKHRLGFKTPEGFARLAPHLMVAAFALGIYVIIGFARTVFVRYSIPLQPIIVLYAAYALVEAGRALGRWVSRKYMQKQIQKQTAARVFTLVLMGVVGFHSAFMSTRVVWLFCQPDTRNLAADWLQAHLKPGEAVGSGMAFTHMDLPKTYNKFVMNPPESPVPTLLGHREFGETDEAYYSMEKTDRNVMAVSTYRYPPLLHKLGIRYLVIGKTPLSNYDPPEFERRAIFSKYKLVERFSPLAPDAIFPPEDTFDPIDAFHLPLATLDGYERPGPELLIFEVP